MSRVGKMPVTVPQGVDVSIKEDQISVKGAGGTLSVANRSVVPLNTPLMTLVDLSRRFVMPGMIDLHVHLWGIGGDPLRERLVMSLDTALGGRGPWLGEGPDHARLVKMPIPLLDDAQLLVPELAAVVAVDAAIVVDRAIGELSVPQGARGEDLLPRRRHLPIEARIGL